MRILFYLPVATEYWFDTILSHMIRKAAAKAEVHIVVPLFWRLTGLTNNRLMRFANLPHIRWHILDGPDHPSFRTRPAQQDALVDFIHQIAPDYVFCRSADVDTPSRFPGKLCYLMEAGYAPIVPDQLIYGEHVWLRDAGLLDHGVMPPLPEEWRTRFRDAMAPLWNSFQAQRDAANSNRETYLAIAGLPADRKIIAVPLDYNGPDNFFDQVHGHRQDNDVFVAELAERIGDDTILAVTVHPIQQKLQIDAVNRIAALDRDKVRIVRRPDSKSNLTRFLIRHADGMIVRDSKTLISAGFYGTPILRLSKFATGSWLNAYSDMDSFVTDVSAGTARAAALEDALVWAGFHNANNAFAAAHPEVTFEELLDRMDQPFSPARWETNLARHRRYFDPWFKQPLAGAA